MDAVLTVLTNVLIVSINGFLLAFYWVQDHLSLLVALGCGLIVFTVFDGRVQAFADYQPARWERAEPRTRGGLRAQATRLQTLVILGLWLVTAGLIYPPPVDFLGMLMWLAMVAGLALLPTEREWILQFSKGGLLLYVVVLWGFRLYLQQVQDLPIEAWTTVYDKPGAFVNQVLGSTVGLITTVATWVIWFALPFAQCSYVVQRLLVHPRALVLPFARAEEVLTHLRERQ